MSLRVELGSLSLSEECHILQIKIDRKELTALRDQRVKVMIITVRYLVEILEVLLLFCFILMKDINVK